MIGAACDAVQGPAWLSGEAINHGGARPLLLEPHLSVACCNGTLGILPMSLLSIAVVLRHDPVLVRSVALLTTSKLPSGRGSLCHSSKRTF